MLQPLIRISAALAVAFALHTARAGSSATLTLEGPQRVSAGEAFELELTLTNGTDAPITVLMQDFIDGFIETTLRRGHETRTLLHPQLAVGGCKFPGFQLAPGKSHHFTLDQQRDRSTLHIDEPGTYRISTHLDFSSYEGGIWTLWDGEVTSNEIVLEVTDPEK